MACASDVRAGGAFVEPYAKDLTTKAFQAVASPVLTASPAGSNVTVSWVSPSPGFVLQENGNLAGASNWADVSNNPTLAGQSNLVTRSRATVHTNQFYRAIQR